MQQVREQLNENSQVVYRPLENLLVPRPGTAAVWC
jgi:hypothetical protein